MEIFERLVEAAAAGRNKILGSYEVRWLVALIKGMDQKLGVLQEALQGAEVVVQAYMEKHGRELYDELVENTVLAEVVEDEQEDLGTDRWDDEGGGLDSSSQEEEQEWVS